MTGKRPARAGEAGIHDQPGALAAQRRGEAGFVALRGGGDDNIGKGADAGDVAGPAGGGEHLGLRPPGRKDGRRTTGSLRLSPQHHGRRKTQQAEGGGRKPGSRHVGCPQFEDVTFIATGLTNVCKRKGASEAPHLLYLRWPRKRPSPQVRPDGAEVVARLWTIRARDCSSIRQASSEDEGDDGAHDDNETHDIDDLVHDLSPRFQYPQSERHPPVQVPGEGAE